MAKTYKNEALRLAKTIAKDENALEEEMKLIEVMSPYHYVRYKTGEAQEGVDFLDAEKHDGETWEYNEKKRTFVRVK